MRYLAFACLLIGSIHTGYAQDTIPHYPYSARSPAIQQAPRRYAAVEPYRVGEPYRTMAVSGVTPAFSAVELDALLKAANILQAAALNEEADRLRRQAHQRTRALLNQLETLQAGAQRLRQGTDANTQILVHLKVMEVYRSELRSLGFDFSSGGLVGVLRARLPDAAEMDHVPGHPKNGTFEIFVAGQKDSIFGVIESLRKERLLRVLAEPTLVSLSGRPMRFHSGSAIPVPRPLNAGGPPVEFRQLGTRIDILPRLLGDGRIHLDLQIQLSELDARHAAQDRQPTIPAVNTRSINTKVEVKAGQTLLLGGLVQSRAIADKPEPSQGAEDSKQQNDHAKPKEGHEEIELIMLISPEIVTAPELPQSARQSGPSATTIPQ